MSRCSVVKRLVAAFVVGLVAMPLLAQEIDLLELQIYREDYAAIFTEDVVKKAEEGYEKLWGDPEAALGRKDHQTELLLWGGEAYAVMAAMAGLGTLAAMFLHRRWHGGIVVERAKSDRPGTAAQPQSAGEGG